jgi:hypothetical protein
MTYLVCDAPGTHAMASPPICSRHRSLRAAVASARRSDRLALYVRDRVTGRVRWVWQAPQRNHERYGTGRFGVGPRHGEPTIAQIIAAIEANRATI